jgi:hypothetical protein
MAGRQQNGRFTSLATISAQVQSTMKAERASKDQKLRAGIASANALGQPPSSDDP